MYREKSNYKLDGLVVHSLGNYEDSDDKNPEYLFKYKAEGCKKKTIVERIDWKISKHGKIIPTIIFKPINLDGNIVKKASGINAQFIIQK
jgi:DNA ligase (NAD+)